MNTLYSSHFSQLALAVNARNAQFPFANHADEKCVRGDAITRLQEEQSKTQNRLDSLTLLDKGKKTAGGNVQKR